MTRRQRNLTEIFFVKLYEYDDDVEDLSLP